MAQETAARSVTLVLTDVSDRTKLTAALGDGRDDAVWAGHDRVVRELVSAWHGEQVERIDGVLALFERQDEALGFARAYQSALKQLDPPVVARVGMHCGSLVVRRNPDEHVARGAKPVEADGLALSVAARVTSIARGGQILATREAIPASDLRVTPHGHWRMKGAPEPVEVLEVREDDAPSTPPPDGDKAYRVIRDGEHWVPVREIPHALPAEWDAFVGRQADLRALAALLDEGARLVTVTGIGGTGKTRLVTHFGRNTLGDQPGGVWFCDLSEARDAQGILGSVAATLDVPLGKGDAVVQLGHAIAGRGRCLVVLDNFEQVARHARDTLGAWLARAPDASFVVTSREVLGLPGEATLALAPLREEDSIDLFARRAAAGKRGFAIGADDRDDVAALVGLLDHLPLAIELAAARVRVLTPKALLERMSERFKLLTSSGARVDRQATLRAALDWSWALLTTDEQAALAQLSVFEGGFTLKAAEAVLRLHEAWPMDAVQSLVDKSLVRRVTDDRLDLLVSVQTYAAERLQAAGDRQDAEVRHGAYFAAFGTDEALESLRIHGGVPRMRALARELDNVVVACRRAVAREEADVAVASLRAAWAVLETRGPTALGAALANAVAELPAMGPTARAACHTVQGWSMSRLGHASIARVHYEAALAICRSRGNRRAVGLALDDLGVICVEQGRFTDAHARLGAALAIHRKSGHRHAEGKALVNLGYLYYHRGLLDECRAQFEMALSILREIGDQAAEGRLLGNLGQLNYIQGRLAEAHAHYDAAIGIDREVGNRRSEGLVLLNLGNMLTCMGRWEEAYLRYEAALVIHRAVGDRRFEGILLANIGDLYACQERQAEAEQYWQEGTALLRELEDGLYVGLVLAGRALKEVKWDPHAAQTHLAEAEEIAAQLQAPPEGELGKALARARAALASLTPPESPPETP